MNGHGKSHSPVVPGKLSNEFADTNEERVEGRELAKGNPREDDAFRTQGRGDAKSGLERVREAAERDRGQKFTALLHHVYDVEGDEWKATEAGTAQGGSISPLLANVYLHYVFDTWVKRWRRTQAHGDVIVVRFADDFVVGFEHQAEAERFLAELKERFQKFGLELHSEKTRLIEFGRHAAEERARRGEGKPETFGFLGFTHFCGKTRNGRFTVIRQTMRKRLKAKLKTVGTELKRRMHAGQRVPAGTGPALEAEPESAKPNSPSDLGKDDGAGEAVKRHQELTP